MPFCTQLARNIVATSVPEEEAYGLHQEHGCESNAYGCRRLGVDMTHKKRIGNVVKARNEHTDYRRNSHCTDDLWYRSLCEKSVVICLQNVCLLMFAKLNKNGQT